MVTTNQFIQKKAHLDARCYIWEECDGSSLLWFGLIDLGSLEYSGLNYGLELSKTDIFGEFGHWQCALIAIFPHCLDECTFWCSARCMPTSTEFHAWGFVRCPLFNMPCFVSGSVNAIIVPCFCVLLWSRKRGAYLYGEKVLWPCAVQGVNKPILAEVYIRLEQNIGTCIAVHDGLYLVCHAWRRFTYYHSE